MEQKKISLLESHPELAKEWDVIRNEKLNPNQTPDTVTAKSRRVAWWLFQYYDPNTEHTFKIRWKQMISTRAESSEPNPFMRGGELLPCVYEALLRELEEEERRK